MLVEYEEALKTNETLEIKDTAEAFLKSRKITLDSINKQQFLREALKAHIEKTKIAIARTEKGSDPSYDIPLSELSRQKRTDSQTIRASAFSPEAAMTEPAAEVETIGELIEEFLKEKGISLKEKTVESYQSTLEILTDVTGTDRNIKSISHKELKTFRDDVLMKLPAKRKILPDFRDKSISEILQMKPAPAPMTRTAQDNKIKEIIAFFNWCFEHEHVDRNPAHHLRIGRGVDPRDARKTYSKQDLEKLLPALAAMRRDEHFEHRYWITLIALFSGAREDEICQMKVMGVQQVDGIWIFDLQNLETDQKVKAPSSHRLIPVHPTLIDLGFITYYNKQKRAKQDQLWPLLTRTRDGYSKKVVRWFTGAKGFNRKHVTKDPKKSFHSLRHGFISNLRFNKVPLDMISEIVGHKRRSQTIDYSDVYPPKQLLEEGMMKLDYGIDVFGLLGKKRPKKGVEAGGE